MLVELSFAYRLSVKVVAVVVSMIAFYCGIRNLDKFVFTPRMPGTDCSGACSLMNLWLSSRRSNTLHKMKSLVLTNSALSITQDFLS